MFVARTQKSSPPACLKEIDQFSLRWLQWLVCLLGLQILCLIDYSMLYFFCLAHAELLPQMLRLPAIVDIKTPGQGLFLGYLLIGRLIETCVSNVRF